MKVVCVSVGRGNSPKSHWLTLHREYLVLEFVAIPLRSLKVRVLADDGFTPILVDSAQFLAIDQRLPASWVCSITEGGIVSMGPKAFLERGFWERFFDLDPDALKRFRQELDTMGGAA